MNQKNILVTGANGQLGSEIKKISDEYAGFHFLFSDIDTLDITDLEALDAFFDNNKIDYTINCAAYTQVDKAEEDVANAKRINVDAVNNLKVISDKYQSKIIHISTDYVFDSSSQNNPFKEDDITSTKSVYGSTKLKGEKIFEESHNAIIIRTSWLYSSFGNNFVKTMLRLGKERKKLSVVFDQVGTPTYANDLAQSILEMLKYSESHTIFKSGIYHYSNEGVCSWYDFATEIMRIANINCHIEPIESKEYPTPAKRPNYSVLNKNKIKNEFGIKITHWAKSLRTCLKIIIDN